MNVLVDTSVWVSYFNQFEDWSTEALGHLLESRQNIFVSPLIIQELLQGLKKESEAEQATLRLAGLTILTPSLDDAKEASKLYRMMRKKGRTIGTIDAHIAALCVKHGLSLLTTDRDFVGIPGLTLYKSVH